jgi:hypothetical protein
MSISEGFLDENSRCRECNQMPPDHDIACPYNAAFTREEDPESIRKTIMELELKLGDLECAEEPDFEAIGELLAKIESLRSYIKDTQ